MSLPTRDFLDRTADHWAYIVRRERPAPNLAVFLHGYTGDYLGTWGRLPHMLYEEADAHPPLDDWDYVFLGYRTGAVECCLDIARRLATELAKAHAGEAPYRGAYARFALLGHSLGTLGIRQLLCASVLHTPATLLEQLHSITLFGTPVNGSPLARFGQWVYPVSDALRPTSPQLRMLKAWTDSSYQPQRWPAPRVLLGLEDQVVGHKFADLVNWAGDEPARLESLGHSAMVKPTGWDCTVVDYLRQALAPLPVPATL